MGFSVPLLVTAVQVEASYSVAILKKKSVGRRSNPDIVCNRT